MSQTSFLYPFLRSDGSTDPGVGAQNDPDHLLAELAQAARSSWTSGEILDGQTLAANDHRIHEAAGLIAGCAAELRRVFVVGNGGSACDAERFIRLLRPSIDARSLLDSVVVTAIANDVGVERMFDRQIETFVRPSDVVVAFTTSGTSANILAALARARRQGAHTIAFAGYGGASLAASPNVEVCLTVESSSVHRIQEAQGTLSSALVEQIAQAQAQAKAKAEQ